MVSEPVYMASGTRDTTLAVLPLEGRDCIIFIVPKTSYERGDFSEGHVFIM